MQERKTPGHPQWSLNDLISTAEWSAECRADVKRKKLLLSLFLVCVFPNLALAARSFDHWPDISGPYLGQAPPGMKAEIFAPGIISTKHSEINSVFHPNGNEFYFTVWTRETGTEIVVTREIEGHWTAPEAASFSNHATDVDPALSPDGERMFFGTRRPRPGETETRKSGFDIWFADRAGNGWGQEKYLGPIVNSGASQVYPTLTREGTLYYQAVREEGYGKADIYRSRLVDGVYQAPENLGPVINSEHYEGDVFIAADESYLIVSIHGRKDSFGEGDLYISFRDAEGSWSPLKNMGDAVNSDKRDFCPMVTPDGEYLLFSSKRAGEGDIYWIDAKIIESLR